jgi:CrcB protein
MRQKTYRFYGEILNGFNILINCLCVGAGGFIGCICRYLLGLLEWPHLADLPVVTFSINIAGSFIIGVIVACVLGGILGAGSPLQLFLQVGFCGGFTTLSTFSVEALSLLQGGHPGEFALYAIATFALSILACAAGMYVGAYLPHGKSW